MSSVLSTSHLHHASFLPQCRVPPDSQLHTIATGVNSVHCMYSEMKELEIRKDAEIAILSRRAAELEALCAASSERERYLVAVAEKLERKLQRRDATIAVLEEKLQESRMRSGSLADHADKLQHELHRATERCVRLELDTERLDRLAQSATDEHAAAMDALALAERLMVQLRSAFLVADTSSIDDRDLDGLASSLANGYADTAFRIAMIAVTECKLELSKILTSCLGDASVDMGAQCRALLEVLRLQGGAIAGSCRVAFMASSLAAPLMTNLRSALAQPCEGDCALVPHRVFAACEAALRKIASHSSE